MAVSVGGFLDDLATHALDVLLGGQLLVVQAPHTR